MRAGVMLATVASCPVWATNLGSPAPARTTNWAPVETARFNTVPAKPVRAEPVPDAAQPRASPRDLPSSPGAAQTTPSPTRVSVLATLTRAQSPERLVDKGTSRLTTTPTPQGKPVPPAQQATAAATVKPKPAVAKAAAPAVEPMMSSDANSALARVLLTRDNDAAPFLIIDKRNARMWLFDAQGQARGNTAVLLGLARGDDTVPGIGEKPLAKIRVGERTTPAGRFVAEPGRNARGDDIFWVDYEAAVSIHRVHDVDRGDHRIQRLSTPSVADNRISYGCINVPIAFFDQTLLPLIAGQRPVVYVLPETRPLSTIFESSADALAARSARPGTKGPSWRPPTSTVSGSSNPSTTL
jgi:hypothetical protein